MRTVMEEKGACAGCIGDQISWPIDKLVPGDVYVADVHGKIEQGPIIGDNLATSIYAKSGNGVVHDAAVRDLDGIKEIPGFTSFVRGWKRIWMNCLYPGRRFRSCCKSGRGNLGEGQAGRKTRKGWEFVDGSDCDR